MAITKSGRISQLILMKQKYVVAKHFTSEGMHCGMLCTEKERFLPENENIY